MKYLFVDFLVRDSCEVPVVCGRCFGEPPFVVCKWLCAVGLLLAFVGCGDGRSSVGGTLSLDGKPLGRTENMQVMIMFSPASGSGTPAAAMADENGRYVLATGGQPGLAPGDYVVTVTATEVTPATSGAEPTKRRVTPSRYARPKESDLRAEVKPGSNTFDFDLNSQASR